ncbi:type 4 fimbrial biogenesis protein PilO [Chromobacterium violaceum ATCC 12472]|uniref:Type 4 fimbrial biogenesis protein PilO n=1 Tax=Chromobacterium violaceum (strain ATCC 12472 / DSM 30191 / JCM 1249 / CCUG 213 / NBRC 12614 / NCIMB 9131 / NCTC 9757 / MK) TaxID=243365 RepID=Q7NZU0_CHRVO|nr:type 4 fimbrial biogenesis protein PilO [Chromobacterium violaceum ATCC 12472]
MDELRALDPKDMPNWPLQAQGLMMFLLLLLVVGLGYFFVLGEQLDKLNQSRQQEATLKQTFVDKKRQAVNLDALEQQLKEIDASFGALLKQLPTKSDMDTLLTEINQAGIGRGLQFDLFKPGGETRTAEMAEVPITLRLTGTYNDLAAFVNDVAQLSRIVTIGEISLTPTSGNRLTMDATARTYRALEPGERMSVQAQK